VIYRASDTPLETLTYITAVIMDYDLSLPTIIGRIAVSGIHFYLGTAEWIIADIAERISSVVQALITNVTTAEASFAAYWARTTNGAAVPTAWKEFMVRFAPDAIRRGQDWVDTGQARLTRAIRTSSRVPTLPRRHSSPELSDGSV